MPNKTSCRLAIAGIAAAIAALPTAVFASEMGLEEIIVTAQKRSESARPDQFKISLGL